MIPKHSFRIIIDLYIFILLYNFYKKNIFILYLYIFVVCKNVVTIPPPPLNPCQPSPCGPYSNCRVVNSHAVCSCQTDYIGTPPMCRPECVVSSECPQNRACINQKCSDPCPGTCGSNARCQVVNHNPICSCSPGYSGDPFVSCNKVECKHERHHRKCC